MYECPAFLEVEDDMAGTAMPLVVRIPRTTAEKLLGRALRDRTDFVRWIETHRSALLGVATLQKPARPKRRTRIVNPSSADAESVYVVRAEDLQNES